MRTTRVFITSLLSAGLILGSVSVAHADVPSPTATPVATTSPVAMTYADQLAAYKVALAAYQIAMDQYRAAWKSAMDQYNLALKAATTQFQADQQLRKAKIKAISVAFQAAVAKARSDKKTAYAAATSLDQKIAADALLKSAISAAAIARQNALEALGPELVRPATPVKPVKQAEPVKPIPPFKSATTLKATATPKTLTPKPFTSKTATPKTANLKINGKKADRNN